MADDHVASGTWGLDPSALASLRLHKSREAYQRQDLTTAILEAEELLEENPRNAEALEVLGDAELELGHGREAAIPFGLLVDIDGERADYRSGLAVALFLDTEFERAYEEALAATRLDPKNAEAQAYAGFALERLERRAEADAFLAEAARLDPQGFPIALREDAVAWKRILKAAIRRLPTEIKDFYRQVPVVWHHFPDLTVLRSVNPPINPMALVLYEGTPPTDAGEEAVLPRCVRAYRGNMLRLAHDPELLVSDLAVALHSEAADWLDLPYEPPPPEE